MRTLLNHRALALGLACLGFLAHPAAQAQKMRLPGGTGPSLARDQGSTKVSPAAAAAAEAAAAVPGIRQADYIVAIVNSEPLTNNEVKARVARVEKTLSGQGMAVPPQDVLAREVLERLILEKILQQQAVESGVRVDDYAVDQAELNVARQNEISVEDMHRRLAAEGLDPKRFRQELRNQMLVQRLRDEPAGVERVAAEGVEPRHQNGTRLVGLV